MKTIIAGITGWASIGRTRSEELRTVDTGLTVLGTLLIAVTLVLLRG